MPTPTDRLTRESGFTLVELLIVVVVIGILASIVLFATGSAKTDAGNAALVANGRQCATAQARSQLDGLPIDSDSHVVDGDGVRPCAPIVTLTKVNGATVTFPYTPSGPVTSVGGDCGSDPGDSTTVNVAVSGQAAQVASCTASGSWSLTLATALTSGSTTVSASQADAESNVGSSGTMTIVY